jgi:hypothetical protein
MDSEDSNSNHDGECTSHTEPDKTPLSAIELILLCDKIIESVNVIDKHFEPIFPMYVSMSIANLW